MEAARPAVPDTLRSPAASGFLEGCLGRPGEARTARKRKQRAVFAAILLELAFVAALVLHPLLSKGQNLTAVIPPTVPHLFAGKQAADRPSPFRPHADHTLSSFHAPGRIPPRIAADPGQNAITASDPLGKELVAWPAGPGVPGGDLVSASPGPARPALVEPEKHRITVGTIAAARLVRRVEPLYPAIPKQLGRSGRVELRAIISTDGSIQSLEVVTGDPLFFESALAAVREWRYRPTLLNGRAVEVDTRICVVYTLRP